MEKLFGLDFQASFVGLIEREDSGKKRSVFGWRVCLKAKHTAFATDYFAGLAHCKRAKDVERFGIYAGRKVPMTRELARVLKPHGALTLSDCEGSVIPNEPTQSYVLQALQIDAQCGDQTFEDFASDLGYDPDSRKAYAIWQACVDTRAQMRKLLGEKYDAFMVYDFDATEAERASAATE